MQILSALLVSILIIIVAAWYAETRRLLFFVGQAVNEIDEKKPRLSERDKV